MRSARWIAVGAVVATVMILPTGASADGGAYIDLDRTHYLPGEIAMGRTSVYVPVAKQGILERGPFFAFILPSRATFREGHPIPDSAIRVGTFSMHRVGKERFDLSVSFRVPALPGAFYSLRVCNDPCTVSGFREPLLGIISVIATAREGALLTQQSRLESRIWRLHRDVRKGVHQGEALQAELDASEVRSSELTGDVERLRARLAGAKETRPSRPLIGVWTATLIAVLLLLLAGALMAVFRRRRLPRVVVPDTVEELEGELESPRQP